MRKKLITGIVVVAVLVLAVLLLRGCGSDSAVPEVNWSQSGRPVYDYEQAQARYIWADYEGEEVAFEADMTVLPRIRPVEATSTSKSPKSTKSTKDYSKDLTVDLGEQGGVFKLALRYKSTKLQEASAENPEVTVETIKDGTLSITVDGVAYHKDVLSAYYLPASAEQSVHSLVNAEGEALLFYLGSGTHTVSVKSDAATLEVAGVNAELVTAYNQELNFSVAANGQYAMAICYESDEIHSADAEMSLMLDDGVPFTEMGAYKLKASAEPVWHTLSDASGAPYMFSLGAGEHKLALATYDGGVKVTGVKLFSTVLPLYAGDAVEFPVEMNLVLDHSNDAAGMGEVTIEVPQDARYEIWLTYRNTARTTLPTELAVLIDGAFVSEEMQRVKLNSLWVDDVVDGKFSTDRYDNEIATTPWAKDEVLECGIGDSAGRTAEPLLFELTAGAHTLSFDLKDGGCQLSAVTLKAPVAVPAYVPGDASGDALIVHEAELIHSRNESSIRGAGEFNARLSPYSSDHREINYLDGASFDEAGDMVTWKINVEKSGWYYLGAYYRQNARADYPTYVDVLIDGKIPSTAAQKVAFPYTTSFETMQATDGEGEPLMFYLEEGERFVSFRINAEALTPVYKTIDVILGDITNMSNELKSLMGGAAADPYRDYKIEKNFPYVRGQLQGWALDCTNMVAYASNFSDEGQISGFSSLTLCADQLNRLAEEPEDLPRRMSEFSTGANSAARMLAQQLTDMANNDLSIDQIYFYQADAELPEKPGFFKNTWEGIVRFFTSFTSQDYAAGAADDTVWVDQETGEEHPVIQVWVGRSRQYVELIQQLADTEFYEETGIRVNLSLMPDANKLVLANAAGTAPDAVLGLQYVVPSYLNIRGALYDLTQIEDIEVADSREEDGVRTVPGFGAVAQRFSEGLFIPYTLEDGVYAMPETVNFWVMFYRTDIFEQNNIPLPDNMEDVKEILPELQRRSMNFYFPTAGMSGMKVFPGTLPLILQRGGSIYDTTIGDTMLDDDASLQGFREMTELFTIYNMPIDVPSPGFYQQFRDGTLPIGIADLATYNLLLNAAPELDGLWDIALYPGLVQKDEAGNVIVDENGNPVVRRDTTGGAETMTIMSAAVEHGTVDESWMFLEWWSRAETQATFGELLQSTYGSEYIWPTANIEAFAQLPLRASHKDVIIEQMEWMTEAPWVLGTYMLERELSNAFITVTADGVEVRRAMDTAVKRIDRETDRKLEEFGYSADGQVIRELKTPDEQVVLKVIEEYNRTHAPAEDEAGKDELPAPVQDEVPAGEGAEPAQTPAADNTTEGGMAE